MMIIVVMASVVIVIAYSHNSDNHCNDNNMHCSDNHCNDNEIAMIITIFLSFSEEKAEMVTLLSVSENYTDSW